MFDCCFRYHFYNSLEPNIVDIRPNGVEWDYNDSTYNSNCMCQRKILDYKSMKGC